MTGQVRAGPMARPALLAFLAMAGVFFARLWALNPADRMMIGSPDGDFMRQFYPYRVFVASAWATGHVPLLNPHQLAGTPAWADPQQAVLYPWRLMQIPLALGGAVLPVGAVELEALVHLALGGFFTFLLLRSLGCQPLAALLGGVAFGFGGYLTGYPVEQLAVLDTAIWIPATLAALTIMLDRAAAGQPGSARRWAVVAGATTALMLLAGHPQTALYGLYAGAAWWLWRARSAAIPMRTALVLGGLWIGVGLGLAAAQWLPSLELMRLAARRLDPVELLAGLEPRDLVQLLAPAVVTQWSPLYVGALPFTLAVWGAWRVVEARFWIALAAVAWLVALGGHGPLLPVLLRIAPAFALFRHHERVAVLVSLALAVAAGLALNRLLDSSPEACRGPFRLTAALAGLAAAGSALGVVRPDTSGLAPFADSLALTALVAGLAAVALLLHLRGGSSAHALGTALILLSIFELFSVNRGKALAPWATVYSPDSIVAALRPVARDGRVSSEARLPGGPNAASVFGLYDVTGDSPLELNPIRVTQGEQFPEILSWRLLGVRYLVTQRAFEPGAPLTELARAGDNTLYRVELPVPPAWVVPAGRELASGRLVDATALPSWASAQMDPLTTIVVEQDGGAAPVDAEPDRPDGGGTARVGGLDPGRVTVDAGLTRPGWLVLSTTYAPGWRAVARSTDGQVLHPAVRVAYGALPAIRLPEGSWAVEWTFRPIAIIVGLVVSGLTLVLGALLWHRA